MVEKEKGEVVINTSVSQKCWGQEWQVGGFSLSSRGWKWSACRSTREALPRTTGSLCDLSKSLPFLDSALPPVKWVRGRCQTRTEY